MSCRDRGGSKFVFVSTWRRHSAHVARCRFQCSGGFSSRAFSVAISAQMLRFDCVTDCETVGRRRLGSLFSRRLVQALLAASFVQVVVLTTLMSQWWSSSITTSYDSNAWLKNDADRSADDDWDNTWWLCNVCGAWTWKLKQKSRSCGIRTMWGGSLETSCTSRHLCPWSSRERPVYTLVYTLVAVVTPTLPWKTLFLTSTKPHSKSMLCKTCFVQSLLASLKMSRLILRPRLQVRKEISLCPHLFRYSFLPVSQPLNVPLPDVTKRKRSLISFL